MRWSGFTDAELDEFRRFQQMSFDIQQTVRQRLTTGATDRDATRWMMGLYRDAGVASYFHLPVALFGDRTTLPNPWDITQFWPTDRALSAGDAVILDASPIFHGYLVDTSTSFGHAPASAEHRRATLDDVAYRRTILDAVRAGRRSGRSPSRSTISSMPRATATAIGCIPARYSDTESDSSTTSLSRTRMDLHTPSSRGSTRSSATAQTLSFRRRPGATTLVPTTLRPTDSGRSSRISATGPQHLSGGDPRRPGGPTCSGWTTHLPTSPPSRPELRQGGRTHVD